VDYFGEIGNIHEKATELGISSDDLLHIVMLGAIGEEIRSGSKHYDEDGNWLETAASVLQVVEEGGTVVAKLQANREYSLEFFDEDVDIDYDG